MLRLKEVLEKARRPTVRSLAAYLRQSVELRGGLFLTIGPEHLPYILSRMGWAARLGQPAPNRGVGEVHSPFGQVARWGSLTGVSTSAGRTKVGAIGWHWDQVQGASFGNVVAQEGVGLYQKDPTPTGRWLFLVAENNLGGMFSESVTIRKPGPSAITHRTPGPCVRGVFHTTGDAWIRPVVEGIKGYSFDGTTPFVALQAMAYSAFSVKELQNASSTSPSYARLLVKGINRMVSDASRSQNPRVVELFLRGNQNVRPTERIAARQEGIPDASFHGAVNPNVRRDNEGNRVLLEGQAAIRKAQAVVATERRRLALAPSVVVPRFEEAIDRCIQSGVLRGAKIDKEAVHLLMGPFYVRQTAAVVWGKRVFEPGLYEVPPAWIKVPHIGPKQSRILMLDGSAHPHPHVQWGADGGFPCWGESMSVGSLPHQLWVEEPENFIHWLSSWMINTKFDNNGKGCEGPLCSAGRLIGPVDAPAPSKEKEERVE